MRQPSESETQVAGKLAASLTPRIVAMPAVRGEQNSGMVDVRALYESSMEQALRRAEQAESAARSERAKRAAMAAQVAHARQQAQAAVAYASSRRNARPAAHEDRTPEIYDDVDLAGEYMVIPGVVSPRPHRLVRRRRRVARHRVAGGRRGDDGAGARAQEGARSGRRSAGRVRSGAR